MAPRQVGGVGTGRTGREPRPGSRYSRAGLGDGLSGAASIERAMPGGRSRRCGVETRDLGDDSLLEGTAPLGYLDDSARGAVAGAVGAGLHRLHHTPACPRSERARACPPPRRWRECFKMISKSPGGKLVSRIRRVRARSYAFFTHDDPTEHDNMDPTRSS